MRGFAANVGNEAEDEFLVNLRRHRGTQVVRHEEARFGQMAQVELVFDFEQIVEHAPGEVAQVGGPLAEVFVLDGFEHGDITVGGGVKGVVGIGLLLADELDDLLDEHAVFEHQQMRVEDVRLVGTHRLGDAALHLEDLLARADERLLKALGFGVNFAFRQFALGDGVARAAEDNDFPAADARRNGDAAKHLFTFELSGHEV